MIKFPCGIWKPLLLTGLYVDKKKKAKGEIIFLSVSVALLSILPHIHRSCSLVETPFKPSKWLISVGHLGRNLPSFPLEPLPSLCITRWLQGRGEEWREQRDAIVPPSTSLLGVPSFSRTGCKHAKQLGPEAGKPAIFILPLHASAYNTH